MTFKDKILSEYKKVTLQISEKYKKVKEKIKSSSILEKIKTNPTIKKIKEKIKSNKYYKYIIILFFIFIVLIAGFTVGNLRSSKEAVLKKLNISLEKGNHSKLSKIIEITSDDDKKVDKEELEPIMEFYKADPNRRTNLINSLKNNKEVYGTKLVSKKSFLSEEYHVQVKLSTLNITTNSKNARLIINGIDNGTIDNEKKVKLITPGEYLIELESQNEYSNIKMNQKISLTQDQTLNMDVNGVKISAKSNFDNAKVYINDKDSGITVKDFKDIGPFPTDGSYTLSAKYKTPWGVLASEIVKIRDIPEVNLDISLKSEVLEASLMESVNAFYESVFKAVDSEDKTKILATDENIQEKIYSTIYKNTYLFKNKYKINNSNIDFEKSTITYNGEDKYAANIVVELNYNVKKEILGVPLKSEDHKQNFFTKLEYKDGTWKVYDIENFSLKSIS